MMVTGEPTVVQIDSDADLDQLVEHISEHEHGHLIVSVHDDSTTLITAAEFHRLLAAARAADVSLAISTGDHLRRELARMLGWSIADRPTTISSGAPWFGARRELVDEEPQSTADLATYTPDPSTFPSMPPPTVEDASRRPSRTGTTTLDRQEAVATGRAEPRSYGHGEPPSDEMEGAPLPNARPGRGRRIAVWATAIVAPLVVLGLVAGILVYVLPTATVTLVPKEQRIAADLTYGLASPGSSYDLTIQPTPISSTSTFDKQIPTTGSRTEPDGTAGGTELLTNPNLQPVTVPAQTQLLAANGLTYVTTKDVTVPAADPYGTGLFGGANVPIAATKPGPDYNTGIGTIVGQLQSGIYYTNKAAIGGGTIKKIAVVSQADVDALTKAAKDALNAKAQPDFNKKIDPKDKLVPGSTKTGDPQLQFSHKVGDDATNISVHGTLEVSGQVFDPNGLADRAKDAVGKKLVAETGSDNILVGNTMTIGSPTPANPDGTAYTVHAEATERAVISDQERSDLTSQLVGKSVKEANQIIGSLSNVASYTIKVSPNWLGGRTPEMTSHIKVNVNVADGKPTNAGP